MADDGLTLNLKILSPSTEVEGGVTFPDLPASTTIMELRSRIRSAVASKPATDRMRLIYRGRVVANDADTLSNVFGPETIRENKDQSLHLVLRELPPGAVSSSPAPRSAIAPPNPPRPVQAPTPASPPLQTNPFRTIPQPRPNSQPQALPQQQQNHHHHHHHHHPHQHPIVHQPHLPGNLPPGLEQHLRHTMTQAQQAGRGTPPHGGAAQTPPPIPGQAPFSGFGQPLPPSGGRTVRQEGIGPNGERWSVTINETNVNMPNIPARMQQHLLPRPIPLPPGFGLPPPPTGRPTGSPAPTNGIDRLLPRVRSILQTARQEMENVRTLFQTPGGQSPDPSSAPNPPRWRVDRIREHIRTMTHNLDQVEQELAVLGADASMAQNADVVSLRQSAHELRTQAESINRRLTNEPESSALDVTPLPTGASSSDPLDVFRPRPSVWNSTDLPPRSNAPVIPFDAPPELFLISSPQGPVGILFDQRGTYTMGPMVSTLPFQTFTSQFTQNRQLIARLGQHIAQGSGHLHNQVANVQPTQQQQTATGDQPANQPQNQVQNQNQPADANANANAPEDRMVNIAGHLWLIFKLACFVYFFAGGGGWYRPIMLGIVASLVYLAQIGIFEEHFNLLRRHFEAVLPVGALADRAAQPRDANNTAQQRTGPTRTMTPEQAAQRLLQQRRDQRFGWVRDSLRTAERSLAIFVASLWPGIGERMVHAQEERARAERVAEEERLRLEEEARAQAAETQGGEQGHGEGKTEGENAAPSASAKGKERAEVAEEAGMPA